MKRCASKDELAIQWSLLHVQLLREIVCKLTATFSIISIKFCGVWNDQNQERKKNKAKPHTCYWWQSIDTKQTLNTVPGVINYLHSVFLAFQFAGDELQSAASDVVPQVASLFQTTASRLRERVALVQLQVVASAIECHHLIERSRIRATLPRDILKKKQQPL